MVGSLRLWRIEKISKEEERTRLLEIIFIRIKYAHGNARTMSFEPRVRMTLYKQVVFTGRAWPGLAWPAYYDAVGNAAAG